MAGTNFEGNIGITCMLTVGHRAIEESTRKCFENIRSLERNHETQPFYSALW